MTQPQHRGASGYPMNAFVTSASAEDLGLVDGADLDSGVAGGVVGSLLAVIVAGYDAETYTFGNRHNRRGFGTLRPKLRVRSALMTVEQVNNSTGTVPYLHHDHAARRAC